MQLSKSDYITYLKHPAWLWMKKYAKAMLPPISENMQAIFDTGHEFEQYAESLFPAGVTVGFTDYEDYLSMPERTKTALEQGAHTIFQGRFEVDELTFICDIVQFVGENELDLYEIKSSTGAKDEHKPDLAFQMTVLERLGYSVRNIAVIHVNNEYTRQGAIEPEKLCAISDVTEEVKALRDETVEHIQQALSVLSLPECPDTSPLLADPSAFGEWLDIYKHMKKTPEGSIYDLCQLDAATLKSLLDNNYEKLTDIPLDFSLKPKQALQVQSALHGAGIDKEKIEEFLSEFEYPLYFLDYESMGSLVPPFDGMRPYQQVPFQYSLYVLDSPDGELRHKEFIHHEHSNPVEYLATALQSDVGNKGTVLAWNMSFEKRCNDTLAEFYPPCAEYMHNINARMQDLMLPFSRNWYVDAQFKGSASIKNILPVLVPELSYKALSIGDGQTAQRQWMEVVLNGMHEELKEKIFEDLLDYCKLDTFAMVEIYRVLRKI